MQNTKYSAIIGLGFGDEGKGLATSYLVSQSQSNGGVPLVIRFNGGHQAGHTVVHEGKRHVFSNYGSGTLQGASTYWSKFCTVNPIAIRNEHQVLFEKGVNPHLIIDQLCPVTTPFDIEWNKITEANNRHGSVGVGFGATIERHENFYKLHYQDLFYPTVLNEKLNNIINYYIKKVNLSGSRPMRQFYLEKWMPLKDKFIDVVNDLIERRILTLERLRFRNYSHFIFEGAQGILLDMDHGFFPNVTRSNTTTKNIYEVLKQHNHHLPLLNVMYVSRTYQTRHGNGFMSNEKNPILLKNNEDETNISHTWQGNFRTGVLDVDMLHYALEVDSIYSPYASRKLLLTCVDQTDEEITYTKKGEFFKASALSICKEILPDASSYYLSNGPSSKHVFKIKVTEPQIIKL